MGIISSISRICFRILGRKAVDKAVKKNKSDSQQQAGTTNQATDASGGSGFQFMPGTSIDQFIDSWVNMPADAKKQLFASESFQKLSAQKQDALKSLNKPSSQLSDTEKNEIMEAFRK